VEAVCLHAPYKVGPAHPSVMHALAHLINQTPPLLG